MTGSRPDNIERRLANEGKDEFIIKCTLNSVLIEKGIKTSIEELVNNISQSVQRGSIVFNRLLLYCLNNGIPLPDLTEHCLYQHCFNVGIGRLNKANPLVEEVWEKFFLGFPLPRKLYGDNQVLNYTSKTYMINFRNSLIHPFDKRQKHFISKWCKENNLPKEQLYPIRCAVNGWNCRTPLLPGSENFIQKQRYILGNPELLTKVYLEKHMKEVVTYYYYISKYIEEFSDSKKFTLAPICNIKTHFIKIDTRILYFLMRSNGLFDSNWKNFQPFRDIHWDTIFNIKESRRPYFTHLIETDGISIHIHFRKVKENRNINHRRTENDRIIAIDPGRNNLLYGVEEKQDGTIKTYKLTKKEYYNKCGFNQSKEKADNWEKNIAEEERFFRLISPKTANEFKFDQYIQNYIFGYEKLWNEKLKKKWGQQRFRTYRLKQKCLDGFFSSLQKSEESKPIIAYGAAKFNSTSRNELSSPTTSLSRKCSNFYYTIMVDEFNTTKMCNCCDNLLSKVVKIVNGILREVRGLRWCSTNCRTLKNRDLNAALNILKIYKSGENRPNYLSRNFSESQEVKLLKIY